MKPWTPALALGLALASSLVQARDLDQDEALRLRQDGTIRPLQSLLREVEARYPHARLLEAELERDDGRYRYEIEILVGDGVRELAVDAFSGAILKDEVDD